MENKLESPPVFPSRDFFLEPHPAGVKVHEFPIENTLYLGNILNLLNKNYDPFHVEFEIDTRNNIIFVKEYLTDTVYKNEIENWKASKIEFQKQAEIKFQQELLQFRKDMANFRIKQLEKEISLIKEDLDKI